ncbi:MAG: ABC transporter permease [Candidatus Bipolaricaulaceae bacterium]
MKQVFAYFLAVLMVFGAWALVSFSLARAKGRPILPYPWQAAAAAGENIWTLLSAFGVSALRFLLALVVAFFVGLPLGLAAGFEQKLEQFLSPLIYLLYPMPPVALLLFLYLAFGLGEVVRLVVVVMALFFQVVVAAQGAAKFIAPTHILAVRSTGASRWQLYWHVVVPATLPSVLTAARVSVGLGITMLYIAETKLGILLPPSQGLGRFIEYYTFRADIALAGVVALALLGLLFYVLLEVLERRLCRWKYVGVKGAGS